MIDGFRPECEYFSLEYPRKIGLLSPFPRVDSRQSSYTAPYQHSASGHGHDDGYIDNYGGGEMYDDGPSNEARMTRLQVFMQHSVAGWPLYTIIIALGQLLSAVSWRGAKVRESLC
jgi:alpha-1,3-glucan synthase